MSSNSTYLERVIAHHREMAAQDTRSTQALRQLAGSAPIPRGFRNKLTETDGVSVIAEIKRRSPSRGNLRVDLDPFDLASKYRAGGAAAISVLTDQEFFGGIPMDIEVAKEASGLPVLRKDFTVSENDVLDARIMGADAVLLIVAALDNQELAKFIQVADEIGLDALVEVHDEMELERALDVGACMIGVNQRDLHTFEVDGNRAGRLACRMDVSVTKVAESGISTAEDVSHLAEVGYDAVLIGESLVTSLVPSELLSQMVKAGLPRGARL